MLARLINQGEPRRLTFTARLYQFGGSPGYGFAKVPEHVRRQWGPMIENYLTKRPNLVGVLHLVDVRHKPTSDDEVMADWLRQMEIPVFSWPLRPIRLRGVSTRANLR